ncbi:MAG: DUF6183 family protein [Acidimicrobiales bacterium]
MDSDPGPDAAERLVERADVDELLRVIDRLSGAADWPELLRVRDLCRRAEGRGRQLWPVASHAEYRLALEASPPWTAQALTEGAGRFALGPLAEVAASTHSWAELAPHLSASPLRSLVAYERVVRGEDLSRDASVDRSMFDLPTALEDWEPTYPVAHYEPWKANFPSPAAPSARAEEELAPPEECELLADLTATEALSELVRPWTTESNGQADAVAVRGDVPEALGALGVPYARIRRIDAENAFAAMAWAAANGGAHGRRRGMATGRFLAWWAAAALVDLADDWPPEPEELGDLASDLRWWLWETGEPVTGWSLRLAVHDAESAAAWALDAHDHA